MAEIKAYNLDLGALALKKLLRQEFEERLPL
jgi:hypothetical protein